MTRLPDDIQRLLDRKTPMRARNGAIIDPVVDVANGIQWFFKYNKFSPSKYKWLAMGEQIPLVASQFTTLTPTPINTDVQSTGVVQVPFNGMYKPHLDFQTSFAGGSPTIVFKVLIDGVTLAASFADISSGSTYYSVDDVSDREVLQGHTLNGAWQVSALGPVLTSNIIRVYPRRIMI